MSDEPTSCQSHTEDQKVDEDVSVAQTSNVGQMVAVQNREERSAGEAEGTWAHCGNRDSKSSARSAPHGEREEVNANSAAEKPGLN